MDEVLAQNQDRIGLFGFAERRRLNAAVRHDVEDGFEQVVFGVIEPEKEVGLADPFAQCKVRLQRSARRADPDHAFRVLQAGSEMLDRGSGHGNRLSLDSRTANPQIAVHEAVAEAPPVAQKIAVHVAVVAVHDPAQLAVAFARRGIAAQAAMHADRRRGLQIPFPGIAVAERLVGEDAGRADFDQVAAEFVFERAVLEAAEIHVVVDAQHFEIVAPRVVVVEADAAVAGDAAVHFMIHERAEILIPVRPLASTIAARGVAGHQRHVLQVAFAAFLADRAVVRVIGHQQLDVVLAELPGQAGIQRNAQVIRDRREAGHHQAAARVFRILVLDHRALPAGADRPHRRMPAKIGQIQSQRQTGSEYIVAVLHVVQVAVDFDPGHQTASLSGRF